MSEYHHRGWHNSIALGKFLYIDGGEIITWDGEGEGLLSVYAYSNRTGNINTVQERYTKSIDLSTSWTNQSVVTYTIEKDAPVVNREALWPDANGQVFYAYDGGWGDQYLTRSTDSSNQLWKFSPNGHAGVWTLVSPSDEFSFSSLSRVMDGSYAFGNGVGYALGGVSNYATGGNDPILMPGLVSFDTTSQQWANVTTDGYEPTGRVSEGAGHFVPSFGPDGLLFSMGGTFDSEGNLAMFDVVSMFEPTSEQWVTQTVSGDIPASCSRPCVVGSAGDNGTYEIFLYGGHIPGDTTASVEQGAVHVLTLPAFRWMKQAAPPTSGRTRHSCNVIGNRQMVVVGGLPITHESGTEYIPPDPWANGLGIFDMSAMEWASQYDANAAPYVSPDMVRTYYENNARYPSWSSPQVEQWFTRKENADTKPASTISPDDPPDNPSDTNKPAIIGGAVGGVLGLLLVVGLLVWLLLRRRKRQAQAALAERHGEVNTEDARAELDYDASARGMLDSTARYEIGAKESRGEVGGTAVYELGHDGWR